MKSDYFNDIPADWRTKAAVFAALGDVHRQRMLLSFEPGERINISQFVEASSLSRTAVAHHLRVLREAGVLRSEKCGKEVWFWIDRDFIKQVLGSVLEYVDANT